MRTLPLALVGALLALSLSDRARAKDERDPSVYARDVEFLLDELEKKAGHFFKLKGIDWGRIETQFRAEAKKVRTDAEHVKLCARLLSRLRDGHAGLVDLKVPWPDDSEGRKLTGPRVMLLPIRGKVYVRAAFGEAAERGIEVGMEVAKIDGVPARTWVERKAEEKRDTTGYSTDHQAIYAACHWGLADRAGTKIAFLLRDGTKTKDVTITRDGGTNYVPIGPVFPPEGLSTVGRQSYRKTPGGFGYVHLRDVPEDLPTQLDTILEAIGDVPGLILDMRANGGGGCDHEAVFGRFLAEGVKWEGKGASYVGQGKRPFTGPMVVIVDAGTRSAGETVSGILKEDGRAYMIGDEPTAGMCARKETLPVPSGMFSAYFAVRSNKARFNDGRGVEGIGVPPHEVVPYDPTELRRKVDTQIRRAEDLLRSGFPKGKVRYEPPKRR